MSDARGQILPLGCVLIVVIALLWSALIRIGTLELRRVQLQIAADSAAQSACALRARGLNSIGRLNGWLGTPELGIGIPLAAWWPYQASVQRRFITIVRELQTALNRLYGGGRTAQLVRDLARRLGADDIYIPRGSLSLQLQRNYGPIWYLSTRTVIIYGVPTPVPYFPEITEESPNTARWYDRRSTFHHKAMRVYTYGRGRSGLTGTPDICAVAAARLFNTGGPMFPLANSGPRFLPGYSALKAYIQADERWSSQLVPVGGPFEH
jgi:hypothetical protein